MPFTSALPTQPSAGQVLKVTAVKSRSGNTRVRLDSGRDDAGNTFLPGRYLCVLLVSAPHKQGSCLDTYGRGWHNTVCDVGFCDVRSYQLTIELLPSG